MKKYKFNNLIEVTTYLKSIDISVPSRSKGRKTIHTEISSIVTFLLHSKNDIFVNFPIELIHADRPDYRIFTDSRSIGIEITESIPEQLARASALLDKYFPVGSLLQPEFFGWDAPKRTNDEIMEIIKKSNIRLMGNGYTGKSIEVNWMKGIYGCIKNKTHKLNKNGFHKFDKNWLLIYDNQTRIFIDKNYVLNNFPNILGNYFDDKVNCVFNKIIIESGSYFYFIDSKKKPIVKIVSKDNCL